MLDHVSVQCDDLAASRAFYERLLAPLGVTVAMDYGDALGLAGPDGFPRFWLGKAQGGVQREIHVAFVAPDRAAVDKVFEAAQELGTEILHEPREWPEYHPGYYGVFVRDPDGNNVEAVTHS
ncbi:catechol 2,3-dioxygenase-like lactoylglutathione lyase family enzyme [Kribbella sp. VKM Ac-2527]|uniref:Catechol 2,3-dioxygenase-like lactoylglutathione lyase family enzyme n=1 Tax=Kribbella caucasensis TaxID=2512215 RepID=A0A4R6KGY5_9ACTN|nr:VOC family protein [Kribbella sp. VKM Ac-2527]TDO50084.1 catechol 2,3-dioxygenase-like lactoylglutathione lyase family enzyme [Kribbella sp. VKM Ac-2527]